MAQAENSKSTLSITADDKSGHLSGTGTLTLAGNKSGIMAAFTAQDNGKTLVNLSLNHDFAIAAGGDLKFEGHGELHPDNGKWSAGTTVTYTADNATVLQLQAQLDATGPSGSLKLSIPL